MKYVIMADGKGGRWNNFMGHSKQEIRVFGETLLERTVRLVHECDENAEVIITSHDESLEIPGAVRYEPKNNVLEIDRFTAELIGDDMCFLYGDVLYSENAVRTIVSARGRESVWEIAKQYGTTVQAVKEANHLDSELVEEGQLLLIPMWLLRSAA